MAIYDEGRLSGFGEDLGIAPVVAAAAVAAAPGILKGARGLFAGKKKKPKCGFFARLWRSLGGRPGCR
jgi:hypothetical protein